jgi:hypothetical protein
MVLANPGIGLQRPVGSDAALREHADLAECCVAIHPPAAGIAKADNSARVCSLFTSCHVLQRKYQRTTDVL